MKQLSIVLLLQLGVAVSTLSAQKILFVDSSQTGISFRGLSVVNDKMVWVSGSKGTIGKSVDGGYSFVWIHPKGFEKRDFRDIEAFDENTAIAMAVDNPGLIIKTTDGGHSWKVVYEKDLHGMFLDAMCFKNEKRGICVGDPINLRFWIIETNDGGDSWQEIPPAFRPTADSGEACFASSGTNIQFVDDPRFEYGFVSGGYMSNLYMMGSGRDKSNSIMKLDINHELETTGANSWAVNGKKYVVLGGDFKDYKMEMFNSTYSMDGGKRWQSPGYPPAGYKSCVIWKDDKNLIATGLTGTDISLKGPKDWEHISDIQFHVVQKAKKGSAIFLAGGNGRIGRYVE
ncbi:MAG: oxidoreductase [Chitinophagaceae bacterium]